MSARLIVCERTGKWAVALRRAMRKHDWPVSEVRAGVQALAILAEAPQSFVVLEFTEANLERRLDCLASIRREYPQANVVGVVSEEQRPQAWRLREFGLADVVHATRQCPRLIASARRHFDHHPPQQPTWRRKIYDNLPWQEQVGQGLP